MINQVEPRSYWCIVCLLISVTSTTLTMHVAVNNNFHAKERNSLRTYTKTELYNMSHSSQLLPRGLFQRIRELKIHKQPPIRRGRCQKPIPTIITPRWPPQNSTKVTKHNTINLANLIRVHIDKTTSQLPSLLLSNTRALTI